MASRLMRERQNQAQPDKHRLALARDAYTLVRCEAAVFKPEA